VHVGLDVVPSTGGTYKTINEFSKISNSLIISFTHHNKYINENPTTANVIHVKCSIDFLGRSFAFAPKKMRIKADEAIKDADLIICHILWRYHVHWVKAHAAREGIPYWVIPHGSLDPYVFSYRSLIKKIWFNLFGYSFLKKSSKVIFATEKEKNKASIYYNDENSCVINWPVEPINCYRKNYAKITIRKKYEISQEEKILIYLGRLHSSKRPLETIKSFALAGVAGAHLLILGPEETISREECMDLVEKLGVRNVHLVGPIYGEEKNIYLMASDVYISLSEKENFGHTVAEALSAGLPVILSPGNDLGGELIPLDCGWILKDNQLETAAVAIKEFCTQSDDMLIEMGQRGRKWAITELNPNKFRKKIEALINSNL
jgi:glycosyltransferase involved in cell wall biosynthesis